MQAKPARQWRRSLQPPGVSPELARPKAESKPAQSREQCWPAELAQRSPAPLGWPRSPAKQAVRSEASPSIPDSPKGCPTNHWPG